jgi:hypothetical protein
MSNCTGGIIPQSVVCPYHSFRILGPDFQYSWNDHFWEKCSKSNMMFLEHTVAVTCFYQWLPLAYEISQHVS